MAGVLRPQPGIRARSVRTVPTEPGVRRSRDPGAVRDLDASKRGIARARGGVAASEDRRRREPRRVHPALRAPGGQARSSRRTSSGRPVAALGNTRRHGSGSACAAGEPRIRRAGRSRQDGVRRHRGAASDLLFDVRVRLLARVRARGARVAAAGGRSRAFPRARRSDQPGSPARSAVAGRGVRAFPAAYLPWQDPLLDRGARHARPGVGRGDRRGGRVGDPAHPDRHGAPRPLERDGARPQQAVRADPRGVQGAGLAHTSGRTWRGRAT